MHSYLRAVGFSKVRSREEIKEIIGDTVRNYDEKIAVEGHPDGIFTEFSKNYGCDCGITVCGQYDEYNRFHVDYYNASEKDRAFVEAVARKNYGLKQARNSGKPASTVAPFFGIHRAG